MHHLLEGLHEYLTRRAPRLRLKIGLTVGQNMWEVVSLVTCSILGTFYFVYTVRATDTVLSSPRILNVPLFLLANKQDTPTSKFATEIRQDYEVRDHHRRDSTRRRFAEDEDEEEGRRKRRIVSSEVLGASALDKACVGQSAELGPVSLYWVPASDYAEQHEMMGRFAFLESNIC